MGQQFHVPRLPRARSHAGCRVESVTRVGLKYTGAQTCCTKGGARGSSETTVSLPLQAKILHDTAVSPLISSGGDHHQMFTCALLWHPLGRAYVIILPMVWIGKGRHGLPMVAGARNGRQISKATG